MAMFMCHSTMLLKPFHANPFVDIQNLHDHEITFLDNEILKTSWLVLSCWWSFDDDEWIPKEQNVEEKILKFSPLFQ
jgi:hypothetical protein